MSSFQESNMTAVWKVPWLIDKALVQLACQNNFHGQAQFKQTISAAFHVFITTANTFHENEVKWILLQGVCSNPLQAFKVHLLTLNQIWIATFHVINCHQNKKNKFIYCRVLLKMSVVLQVSTYISFWTRHFLRALTWLQKTSTGAHLSVKN